MSGFIDPSTGEPTRLQWVLTPADGLAPGIGSITITLSTIEDSVAYGAMSADKPAFEARIDIVGNPAATFWSGAGVVNTAWANTVYQSGADDTAVVETGTVPPTTIAERVGAWLVVEWSAGGAFGPGSPPPWWQQGPVATFWPGDPDSSGLDYISIRTSWDGPEIARWVPDGHPDDPQQPPDPGGGGSSSSAAGAIPGLLGPIAGLPTTDVIAGDWAGDLNNWDAANDIADRSGVKLIDLGDGWEALDPIPPLQAPAIHIAHGVNLISASHSADIDNSEHSSRVLMEYEWPDPADPTRTITCRAHASGGPGEYTTVHRRRGVPISQAIAQQTAQALADRAWLRGADLTVVTTCVAWVRPGDTIRVTLPDDDPRDWWCASARHDSTTATSTLVCRAFTLEPYSI